MTSAATYVHYVKDIRKLAESGISATDIAAKYNVSKSTTSRIIKNKTWLIA